MRVIELELGLMLEFESGSQSFNWFNEFSFLWCSMYKVNYLKGWVFSKVTFEVHPACIS